MKLKPLLHRSRALQGPVLAAFLVMSLLAPPAQIVKLVSLSKSAGCFGHKCCALCKLGKGFRCQHSSGLGMDANCSTRGPSGDSAVSNGGPRLLPPKIAVLSGPGWAPEASRSETPRVPQPPSLQPPTPPPRLTFRA